MKNFPTAHIISGCGIFASDQKRIYVGDTKGVTSFSEEEFHKANTFRHNPNLYFSELWINNQKVVAGDETGVLTKAFPYTQKLKLSHNQNNLILSLPCLTMNNNYPKNSSNINWTGSIKMD